MATKNTSQNNNVNNNNNHVNVNVNIEHPSKQIEKTKNEPNWYARTIIGGIISVIVALAIYYGQQNMNNHKNPIQNDLPPVTGTKQTKN